MTDRLRELVGTDFPYWKLLGIEIDHVELGQVRLRLPIHDDIRRQSDTSMVHGGAIASLIDAAAASAVRTLRVQDAQPWVASATTDLNISYIDAATTDLIAEARVLRPGRSTAFVSIEVRDVDEKLVAVGRATFAIRRQ